MEKPAKTDHPIHELLARRWSPRAFSDRAIEPENVRRLFEAARWSASSFNEQPWRFIAATKDDAAAYARVLACLVEANQAWARSAPLLILTLSKKTFTKTGKPNRVHEHDIGLAAGNLTVQAMAMGLFVHQMAGIEPAKIRATFAVPEEFEPVTAIAVGYGADPSSLPEGWMREAEASPRARKPLRELVFTARFGEASPLVR